MRNTKFKIRNLQIKVTPSKLNNFMIVIFKFMLITVRRVLIESTLYSVYQPRSSVAEGGRPRTGLENVSKIKQNIFVKIK